MEVDCDYRSYYTENVAKNTLMCCQKYQNVWGCHDPMISYVIKLGWFMELLQMT